MLKTTSVGVGMEKTSKGSDLRRQGDASSVGGGRSRNSLGLFLKELALSSV